MIHQIGSLSHVARRVVAGLLLCLACTTTRGGEFNVDMVPKIRPDVTTQEEVREWFGEPVGVRMNGSGQARWVYLYEEETRRDVAPATLGKIDVVGSVRNTRKSGRAGDA